MHVEPCPPPPDWVFRRGGKPSPLELAVRALAVGEAVKVTGHQSHEALGKQVSVLRRRLKYRLSSGQDGAAYYIRRDA